MNRKLFAGAQWLLVVMASLAAACVGDGFQSWWSAVLAVLVLLICIAIKAFFAEKWLVLWNDSSRRLRVILGMISACLAALIPSRALSRLMPVLAQQPLFRGFMAAELYITVAAVGFVLLLFLIKWNGSSLVLSTGLKGLAVLLAGGVVMWWVVEDSWTLVVSSQEHAPLDVTIDNIVTGHTVVEQELSVDNEQLQMLAIYPCNPQGTDGTMLIELVQGEDIVYTTLAPLAGMGNAEPFTVPLSVNVALDEPLVLRITAERPDDNQFFSLYSTNIVSVAGRYAVELDASHGLRVNGQPVAGMLCYDLQAVGVRRVGPYYWGGLAALVILWGALVGWVQYSATHETRCFVLTIAKQLKRFSFLVEQLVSRDFNTKYRQSILGVLWSFLNPLMTTFVLYFVFSTLFQNSTPNFIVYLLSGLIMYNFFTEATGLGLESITANASLINKVYVPRYIYPLSRVMSSMINLVIGIIPLVITCLVTGLHITKAYFLLPFPLICVFCFACGMSFLLATSNVFFRDTKFLWGIVTMMWMYLTPVFYPESIIPASFIRFYHMNPLYQFIYFLRCIVINGVTPQPITYLYSLLAAVVPLLVGIWVFNRQQQKFVMYL